MALDTQQQMLIEQRITNDGKSTLVAYLLLVFLGGFGAHRFYLGRIKSGVAMLVLFVLGWATLALVVGAAFLLVVGIWAVVDLFLIPGMIAEDRNRLRENLRTEMSVTQGTGAAPFAATPAAQELSAT